MHILCSRARSVIVQGGNNKRASGHLAFFTSGPWHHRLSGFSDSPAGARGAAVSARATVVWARRRRSELILQHTLLESSKKKSHVVTRDVHTRIQRFSWFFWLVWLQRDCWTACRFIVSINLRGYCCVSRTLCRLCSSRSNSRCFTFDAISALFRCSPCDCLLYRIHGQLLIVPHMSPCTNSHFHWTLSAINQGTAIVKLYTWSVHNMDITVLKPVGSII